MHPLAHHSRRQCLRVALAALALSTPALAQPVIRSERIRFKKGASSAIVNGRIQGAQTVDYLIDARQGQSANISLATKHTATYFNILAPGKTDEALFNGSTGQNQFEGVLPADGTYRVRVYMMRSAARRNETARYRLEVIIGSAAGAARATAPSTDAKVQGTDFHATGQLPCAVGSGPMAPSCSFGVKRAGRGNGTVELTRPDGGKRTVFFQQGRATGYDASQADKPAFKATRQGDSTLVQIGDERYEIPDAVIQGG